MPAETHQRRDEVTAAAIVDFLIAVLAPSDVLGVGPDTLLVDLGVDNDLALFDLWDVVAEEYGERSLGAIDLDELRSADTIGALTTVFTRSWTSAGPSTSVT